MFFSFLCPCERDTEMSPWHQLWKGEAQIQWHFQQPSHFSRAAEQRMSQTIAQHHLPDAPEPKGRVPTIAPMELMEQDPSHS